MTGHEALKEAPKLFKEHGRIDLGNRPRRHNLVRGLNSSRAPDNLLDGTTLRAPVSQVWRGFRRTPRHGALGKGHPACSAATAIDILRLQIQGSLPWTSSRSNGLRSPLRILGS